jgi:hypothetical protein
MAHLKQSFDQHFCLIRENYQNLRQKRK